MISSRENLELDQRHYIEGMKEMPVAADRGGMELLNWQEQTAYRSLQ